MIAPKNIFLRYWRVYGGFNSLFKSIYFWGAISLTALLYPHWSSQEWWNDALSIMPNLLGFSLGGYAMFLAISDKGFIKLIAEKDEDDDGVTIYLEMNSTFIHFILLQICSIITAIIRKTYNFPLSEQSLIFQYIGDFWWSLAFLMNLLAYFFFIYALVSAIAATFALFRTTCWYSHYINEDKED